jgi:hypothetical protein
MNNKILLSVSIALFVALLGFVVYLAVNAAPTPAQRQAQVEEASVPPEEKEEAVARPAQNTENTNKTAEVNAELVPHRALYDINLIAAHAGGQIANISGTMFFELRRDCEAWMTDHRFNLIYEYTDSPAMQITSDFSTWESLDGERFYFSSRRSRDGEIYEILRGEATSGEEGGVATFSQPEGLEFDLSAGTIFPMQHTKLLAEALKNDKGPFLNRVIFDGSDQEGPVEINAFIGNKVNAMAQVNGSAQINPALLNSPAKTVQMAFFPMGSDSNEPGADYEMEAVFHQNGVISDMTINYKEFSISQKLNALEESDDSVSCQTSGTSKRENSRK